MGKFGRSDLTQETKEIIRNEGIDPMFLLRRLTGKTQHSFDGILGQKYSLYLVKKKH
jgi:hypothetical protein